MIESKTTRGKVKLIRRPSVKAIPLEDLGLGDFFRFYTRGTLFQLISRDEGEFRYVETLTGCERTLGGGDDLVVPVEVTIHWRDCLADAEGDEEND